MSEKPKGGPSNKKDKMVIIDIPGGFTGDISISTETPNTIGDKVMPLGVVVEGETTVSAPPAETKQQEADGVFSNRRSEKLETEAKHVVLKGNRSCQVTLNEPETVQIEDCRSCKIDIWTTDPEKISVIENNNRSCVISYYDPADGGEWDWPPDEDDDSDDDDDGGDNDDEDGNQPTIFSDEDGNPKVVIGGKITGNKPVIGNDQVWEDGERIK